MWEEEFFVEASVSTLFCNSETETVMHGHAHHGWRGLGAGCRHGSLTWNVAVEFKSLDFTHKTFGLVHFSPASISFSPLSPLPATCQSVPKAKMKSMPAPAPNSIKVRLVFAASHCSASSHRRPESSELLTLYPESRPHQCPLDQASPPSCKTLSFTSYVRAIIGGGLTRYLHRWHWHFHTVVTILGTVVKVPARLPATSSHCPLLIQTFKYLMPSCCSTECHSSF